jgi:glyoxylase-like metal-dependent hydrolase (beta-lactamase superfamily II)
VIGPHKEDKFWLDAIEQHSSQYGFSGMYNCTPDEWLEEGQQIKVGEETLDVYHCPGHTPGHVILHHADSGLAIVGDVLFEGSIGRTDFPRGDYQTLINSITTKLWPLGNNTRFIPGHGNMSDFGRERASNPFVSDTALSR